MTTIAPALLHEPGSPAYEDACVLFNAMIATGPGTWPAAPRRTTSRRRWPSRRRRGSRSPSVRAATPSRGGWALRGGGGNFGVVTALELTLHPVGAEVLAGLVVYPEARAAELL